MDCLRWRLEFMGGTTPFTIITGGYWHYQKVSSLRESKKRSTHQHYVKMTRRWSIFTSFYSSNYLSQFCLSFQYVFVWKKTKIKLIILREYWIQGPLLSSFNEWSREFKNLQNSPRPLPLYFMAFTSSLLSREGAQLEFNLSFEKVTALKSLFRVEHKLFSKGH